MFKPAVFNIQHLNSNREDFFTFIFLFCIKLQERLIKIQYAHISKSYLKFWHIPELSHSVHQDINPSPLKNTLLPIFCQAFCKLSNSLFRQFPIYIVFLWHLSPKNWWIPIVLTFFIFNPSYLFKVTKFLVKNCQYKFLVTADKHFGL